MSDELKQLRELEGQLHEVNEELARAARPLSGLSNMNEGQRQEIATKLRAGLARWEDLTQQIARVLHGRGPDGRELNQ